MSIKRFSKQCPNETFREDKSAIRADHIAPFPDLTTRGLRIIMSYQLPAKIALDAHEVAALLGSTYATVCEELRQHRLVGRKVGKQWRVHPDSVEEYLRCPGPKNQPDSEKIKKAAGSFSTPASKGAPDTAATAAADLLRKLSQGISRRN